MDRPPRLQHFPGPRGDLGKFLLLSVDRKRYQWVVYDGLLWKEDRRFRATLLRQARRDLRALLEQPALPMNDRY